MNMIQNPEKEFQATPELTETSQIVDVVGSDYRRGIIFNTPEELAEALVVYNGGSVQGTRATQNNLMDAVGNKGGGMGAALLLLEGAMNADGFTERLVQEALSDLQSRGRFHRSFEYDATGTNFFKTTVECQRVNDKYVLELSAAYVGSKPENRLAETLDKPMALVRSSAIGKLSIVDDWWFNVNLEDVLQGLPIPKEQISGLAEYIASRGYSGKEPKIEFEHSGQRNGQKNIWLQLISKLIPMFKHNGQKFALKIGLDADRYLRPENGESGSEYMQARGDSIVGGAWTTWDENGNGIAPRPKEPGLVLSVSFPGDRYSKPPIVEPEEMELVQGARDYLAGLLIQPAKE